ncbi:MAG: dynamin family protein, partial [Myxococcales bacterium]|nr:dynamin family protein [Myxococcales bacterium]
ALTLLGKRLEADPDTAPEELHLARTRALLRAEDPGAGARFLPGPSPQYRAGPALGGPYGPDEVSPLRDPDTREATLLSQISLATAEYLLSERTPGEASDFDRMSAAQEHLVAALSTAPQLARARALLTSLSAPLAGTRLEDFLTTATTVLAAIPGHVLGVPLAGVQEALSGVIAARERLARPLTIAIMGEFSSGKSTFVNALLGEAIAPMGVLPTTSTINLFRRGPGGGARIHYRDGSIATLARGEVQRFLHGLDDVEASRIRHTEIERTGKHMGDAAVVDTPGLNALDGFHERVARDFIDESDAVVWIFSATRGGAASEAGLLNSMRADGRKVLGVVNKVDTLDDGEKEELCEYLQEQLGDVLADVIPVCASAALERRIAHADGGEDPDDLFAPVEHALEEHFLKHARELKRAVTIRRLQESLQKGKGAVLTAVDVLAARAEAAAREDDDDASAAARRLAAFADKVHALVLELDDVLTRELLSLGVVRKGGARKTMTVQDDAYLGAVLRDQALRALQAAIGELSREEDTPAALTEVLGRHLIPWARGYLDGLDATRFVTGLVRDHGEAIERGEQALRERLRTCMTPIAASWQRFARGLERELRQATIQGRRHAAARPRAEVLRLKTTTVASIDALLAGLDSIA